MTRLPPHHWAYGFSIDAEEIDNITNLLLEKETPLSSAQLAIEIVTQREAELQHQLEQLYKDTKLYQPSDRYEIGEPPDLLQHGILYGDCCRLAGRTRQQRLRILCRHVGIRWSICVRKKMQRQFATRYDGAHPLNDLDEDHHPRSASCDYALEDILIDPQVTIVEQVNEALEQNPDLVQLAGSWFVRDLILEVDIGHLHLAEAVLDMSDGGPISPSEILQQIGGLGDSPVPLQVFSLNYAMNQDDRFDEVGPAGQVLWHLRRLLPRMVRQVPKILQYVPEPYDRNLLRNEMLQLEYDLDDEHSPISSSAPEGEISLTLIYPHRRGRHPADQFRDAADPFLMPGLRASLSRLWTHWTKKNILAGSCTSFATFSACPPCTKSIIFRLAPTFISIALTTRVASRLSLTTIARAPNGFLLSKAPTKINCGFVTPNAQSALTSTR